MSSQRLHKLRGRLRSEEGTSFVEFALVASLLFSLLFGIVEFGLAFRDRLTISNATQGAVRVGSALGDNDESDYEVLLSLEQSLSTLPNSGIDIVRWVDLYRADAAGNPVGGAACPSNNVCNRYVYTPGAPGCDWVPCPDPATYSGWDWAPSARDVALPGLDVIAVRLTFKHDWVTGGLLPLPNIQCDGTPGSSCWNDAALMRLEPQVFAP